MTNKTNFRTNPEQLKKAHASREINKRTRPTYVPNTGKVVKRNQVLPQNVVESFAAAHTTVMRNDYIHELSKAGWTASAIAKACGLSREAIRLVLRDTKQEGELPLTMSVPEPLRYATKMPMTYTEPSPEMLARLKELKPLASLVRSSSPRYRAEAEEYSYLLNEAVNQGVTVYRLAKLLGVTPSAISFRLVRYGYKTTEYGQTKAYKPINTENRKKTTKTDETATM